MILLPWKQNSKVLPKARLDKETTWDYSNAF